jgi:RimJ/RimL family protein N-acetyltransferase
MFPSFEFRLAKPEDKAMIEDWVHRPHIREWLHGEGLDNTLSSLLEFFAGRSFFQHWIAYEHGIPFGYLLTSTVDPGEEVFSAIEFAGDKAISLDVFICEPDYLGKGYGTEMITQFIRSQIPNISDVLIDPEVSNSRAVRAYEKVGFRIIETFVAPWHPVPHYLMHLRYEDL